MKRTVTRSKHGIFKMKTKMTKYLPWYSAETAMQPNVLLMCKLLFALLLLNGFYGYLGDPYLPFFDFLDYFRQFPGVFEYCLRAIFILSGGLLLLNIRTKTMALLLGAIILVALLASKSIFRNHLFICGCAFLLAGLTDKNKMPWLLYIQLSLVYLGAATNKILQVDWWSGQYMHNWMAVTIENDFYLFFANALPEGLTAKLISWGSMLAEIVIGILLLFRRKQALALWLILLFHTFLFTITKERFGHFLDDILIYLLVFLNWPSTPIQSVYHAGRLKFARKLIQLLNWNRQIEWKIADINKGDWLKLEFSNKSETNEVALRSILLYSPGLYIVLFILDLGIRFVFDQPIQHIILCSLFWGGILFFLPFKWRKNTFSDDS